MRARIIQIVLLAVLLLSVAMPAESRAADRGAAGHQAAQPAPPTPLTQLLNPDNTLNLGSGFSGSLDADGWAMHMDSSGTPRFVPAAQSGPTSVPDDAAWDSRFGRPGVNGTVATIVVSETDVYVGGSFTQAGNVWASSIARWDGTSWFALGDGLQLVDNNVYTRPFVSAIAISGTDVYVGGSFNRAGDIDVDNIARWDGRTWHALGDDGTQGVNAPVYAITVAESNVYVGGAFTLAGGVATDYIARWDGASWAALGNDATNGVDNIVYALASQGKKMYVGGRFTHAGGKAASLLAIWDNSKWQEVGGGLREQYHDEAYEPPAVRAIAISGDNVYVGGIFNRAGTIRTNNIIRWNGRSWYNLGPGIDLDFKTYRINAITIRGADIYVGGEFSTVNGSYVNNIVRWDDAAWQTLGAGSDNGLRAEVMALASDGSNIYVGSGPWRLPQPPPKQPPSILRWADNDWHVLGGDQANGVDGVISTIAISGTNVFVGGTFTRVGSVLANNIARWDGVAWHALGIGPNNGIAQGNLSTPNPVVQALVISGKNLYVGGLFSHAGGIPALSLARWDGSTWSAVGAAAVEGEVSALAVIGSDIYIAGNFYKIGALNVNHIARWDGSTWSSLGSGLTNKAGYESAIVVDLLTVVGESLYVGGAFSEAGGISTANIARWDGDTWHTLGSGVDYQVLALATDGANLYVGGHFTMAGGVAANHLARWDGTSWHVLGSATAIGGYDRVNALAAGGGNVYISGDFHSVGGVAANTIARWDGTAWRSLGSGIASEESESPFIFPALGLRGNDLYIGGSFISAGGRPSVGFAHWNTRPLRHVFLPSISL